MPRDLNHTHAVGLSDIDQLDRNFRTHQGVLDTAALLVDLIKVCDYDVWMRV